MKIQGQKGKCKDDIKSYSLDRFEQVERSKIINNILRTSPRVFQRLPPVRWRRRLRGLKAEAVKTKQEKGCETEGTIVALLHASSRVSWPLHCTLTDWP